MSASARVDPDFRSEPSTTDAPRTARFGNPPRRPLLMGLLAALMLLVGGFGAGGVLVRDPYPGNIIPGNDPLRSGVASQIAARIK